LFVGSLIMVSGLVATTHTVASAQGQAVVHNLRLVADANGTPMEQVDAGPGERRYHLDAGVEEVHMAFDCMADSADPVSVQLKQPPGAPLDVQSRTCSEAGTQVVTYTNKGPLSDNEYVVNLYVGDSEPFIADSIEFTVGAAEIQEGPVDNAPPVSPAGQATVVAAVPQAPIPNTEDNIPGGPSTVLLALAGAGVLGLLAIVVWAGWSAMKTP
jgi:hypothetical protein